MWWIVIVAVLIAATDQSMKEYVQLWLCMAHSDRKKICMHSSSRVVADTLTAVLSCESMSSISSSRERLCSYCGAAMYSSASSRSEAPPVLPQQRRATEGVVVAEETPTSARTEGRLCGEG